MRYTTEFKISPDLVGTDKNIESRIEWMKEGHAYNLGKLIGERGEWQDLPADGKHFRLEVQVFHQKKWEMFRSKMIELINEADRQNKPTVNFLMIKRMLEEVESENKTQE